MYEIYTDNKEGLIVKYNGQVLEGIIAIKVESEVTLTIKPTEIKINATVNYPKRPR